MKFKFNHSRSLIFYRAASVLFLLGAFALNGFSEESSINGKRARARDLGVRVGTTPTGKWNAITDHWEIVNEREVGIIQANHLLAAPIGTVAPADRKRAPAISHAIRGEVIEGPNRARARPALFSAGEIALIKLRRCVLPRRLVAKRGRHRSFQSSCCPKDPRVRRACRTRRARFFGVGKGRPLDDHLLTVTLAH